MWAKIVIASTCFVTRRLATTQTISRSLESRYEIAVKVPNGSSICMGYASCAY